MDILHILPVYASSIVLHLFLEPQEDAFDEATRQTLLTSEVGLTNFCDCMGYRLSRLWLQNINSPDILSEGAPFDSV
jgi:allophanate hydrolase subunit 2